LQLCLWVLQQSIKQGAKIYFQILCLVLKWNYEVSSRAERTLVSLKLFGSNTRG
jgi:hypothetical protein